MGEYEDRWEDIKPSINNLFRSADLYIDMKQAEYENLKNEYGALSENFNKVSNENAELRKALEDCKTNKDPAAKRKELVGIQVFPDRRDLSYWDHESTFQMLKFLNIKNVRGSIGPAITQRTVDFYNRLYDELGISACLTVGKPRVVLDNGDWDKIDNGLRGLRGVTRLSGWNEPNHRRGQDSAPLGDWVATTTQHTRNVWNRYNADYIITSMQMWAGNLNDHDDHLNSLAPKVRGFFHEIAWHLYQPGLDKVERFENLYRGHFGDLPIVCTETGMSTAPNQRQNAESMSEAGQAAYIVEHLERDYVSRGHRCYWFELRDEYDPAGEDREDWLGIFRHDASPKPAAWALKEYLEGAPVTLAA